jgi:predicted LPLAT superfamily acyltransferase
VDLSELPLPLGLHLAERLSADPEQVRRLKGGDALLAQAGQFAHQLSRLFGPGPPADAPERLTQERLAFLLARPLVDRALSANDPGACSVLATRTTVRGREHLEASVARGHGTVLVSTHFGYPILARLVLETLGVPVVVAAANRPGGQLVSLEGDVWSSVRALRRLRASLDANAVSVLVVDGMTGSARVAVPFFRRKTHIGLGAFHLARLAGCPVVPFFAVAPRATGHFDLTFLPPLDLPAGAQDQALTGAVRAFVEVYRPYASRYPSHLPHRALFQD